ncbi:hypothetical protein PIB30_063813 [Stylosanthes scabra]|uniref:Uncharacterized protein n=1 Tax=Stylosanthes scabra TaxID=79078 RepID=A0ABU6YM35_9FABA|nr:hypothetical protein [Stylosanthes scabra]
MRRRMRRYRIDTRRLHVQRLQPRGAFPLAVFSRVAPSTSVSSPRKRLLLPRLCLELANRFSASELAVKKKDPRSLGNPNSVQSSFTLHTSSSSSSSTSSSSSAGESLLFNPSLIQRSCSPTLSLSSD